MSHKTQKEWCKKIKNEYPEYFLEKRVLDIGSLDINGTNKDLFENCEYIGLDVIDGKNVDIISIAHEYKTEELFDVILSTNSLEHDMYFRLTLKKMVDLLKPLGIMFFSVAHKFKEHGTLEKNPEDSGTAQMSEEWANYYKNLNIKDITDSLDLEKIFVEFYLGIKDKDLIFWGIKNK